MGISSNIAYEEDDQKPKKESELIPNVNEGGDEPPTGPSEADKIKEKTKKELSETLDGEDPLLESKLELLHNCLVPSSVPQDIPAELSMYTVAFEEFLQSTKGIHNFMDSKYIQALSKFRDILLGE